MRARGKFSLLDRVFRVPFLDFNDVSSAIISSSMERFRLALALPGTRQDRRSGDLGHCVATKRFSPPRLLGGEARGSANGPA